MFDDRGRVYRHYCWLMADMFARRRRPQPLTVPAVLSVTGEGPAGSLFRSHRRYLLAPAEIAYLAREVAPSESRGLLLAAVPRHSIGWSAQARRRGGTGRGVLQLGLSRLGNRIILYGRLAPGRVLDDRRWRWRRWCRGWWVVNAVADVGSPIPHISADRPIHAMCLRGGHWRK